MSERRWLVWADETPQVPNRQLTLDEAIVAFRDYVEDDTEEKVEIRQVDPQDLMPLDVPEAPPEGHEWVWVPSGDMSAMFELLPDGVDPRPCRWTVGPGHVTCKAPSVARLYRGSRPGTGWWHYCGDHLYGRRIREGVLETRIERPLPESEAS